MPMQRYKPEQIVTLLQQIEVAVASGKATPLACQEAGITTQMYYRWRKEYGGLKMEQAKLAEQLFDIAERERVPKVPAHSAKNQLGLGLSPLEDRRSDCLLHDLFRLPAAAGQSCNTTSMGRSPLHRC